MSRAFTVAVLLLPIFLLATANADDRDLIGTQATEWDLADWMNTKPLTLKGLRGKVVLVRWWTGGGCPYCAATAPALNEFHSQYSPKGLVVVGIYHHKETEPLTVDKVKEHVHSFGFEFPVAVDPEWRTLKRWWLNDSDRQWTSVSFLIDRQGVIRHIHPGGSYVKGDKAYQTMKSRIELLLKEE